MTRMPKVTSQDLVKFLIDHGYEPDRQSGSHLTLYSARSGKSITVPIHRGCEIGRGLAVRILKDAGFSIDDYIDWI